jgi:hypothetical protein
VDAAASILLRCKTVRRTHPFADQAVPLVSSLATVSSGSYLFVIYLASAAYVFAFNQELTKDTGNCISLGKVVALHLCKNIPTLCAFQIFFGVFTRTHFGASCLSQTKPGHSTVLISFQLLLDMRGDPKNYRNC